MKNLLPYTLSLKHLPRSGWLRHQINNPETVAAHSWNMSIMALKLAQTEKGYDFDKVIRLSLCHDIGESIIGDITPSDARYAQKSSVEEKAIEKIAAESHFSELHALFQEYEENQTPEAKLAHDLDKLDMLAQAIYYQKRSPQKDLSEFYHSAVCAIQTDIGKALLQEFETEIKLR